MTATTNARVRVWDRAVRALHWSLVVSVAVSAASLLDALGVPGWHRPAGYVALAIVWARVVWGFAGRGHARFAQFVRAPDATLNYLRLVLQHREPRTLGHNPLGAWMIVALLLCVSALAFTGWLYTTEMFWGSEGVEDVHRVLAWTLLALVALHVAGVIFTSWRQRENLVRAMFDGRKAACDDA
jgi:cytochrome b